MIVGSKPSAVGWLSRLWLLLYGLVSRCLLKTWANEFRPAVAVGPKRLLLKAFQTSQQIRSVADVVARLQYAEVSVVESTWSEKGSGLFSRSSGPGNGLPGWPSMLANLRLWWNECKFPAPTDADITDQRVSRRQGLLAWSLLLAATLFVLCINLGYPLFEPDEARNAELSLNVVRTGQWMSLELGGERYWDKPPLMAWAVAVCYKLFGVSEFTTRLPGNLAAVGMIIVTFGLGRRLVGFRAAWLGALALIMSAGFVVCGRYVTMDAALTLSAVVTLWGAYFACDRERFSYRWWIVSAIAGGLGLLIKGPVVAVLTLPVLIAALALNENRMLLSWRRCWIYLGIVLVIAGPWYLATGIVQPEFLLYFFWQHNVVRFSQAFNHQEPWWFYIPVLLLMMFPISYLLPSLPRGYGRIVKRIGFNVRGRSVFW